MILCKCKCENLTYLSVGDIWKCPCGRTWQLLFDGGAKKMILDFLGLRKEEACKS